MATPNIWARTRRRWQAWRAWLRREHTAAALVVLLTLGLGEPLLCVVHCQLWLPIAFSSYFGAQHQHHHHAAAAGLPGPAAQLAPTPAHGDACVVADGGASVPFHVPPSPIHDMIATLVLVVVALRLLFALLVSPPGDPPPAPSPPFLRPPIAGPA